MILVFFILFFPQLLSQSLSIIVVAGPKKRPCLTVSMKSLKESLLNKPKSLTINHIFLVKGCKDDCFYPSFDSTIDEFSETFPDVEVSFLEPKPESQHGINGEGWLNELLSATWSRTGNADWSRGVYQKHITINYFFMAGTLTILNDEKKSDFILYAEDDQLYTIDAFTHIYELMKQDQTNTCFSKIAFDPYVENEKKTINPSEVHIWGAWGVLRSRKQMEMFIRFEKFSYFSESEDALGVYLCQSFNKVVEVDCVSKHFGRDQRLPRV